ncbi:MAG: iron ABC transporter permease [bacterium]
MSHRPLGARLALMMIALGVIALLVLLICPLVGPVKINLSEVFDRSRPFEDNTAAVIFFRTRLPRVLLGLIVGAALATAGVVFQALLRNDLATPFTLGVSGGAALGAVVMVHLGLQASVFGLPIVSFGSFLGALLAVAIIYMLARSKNVLSTNTLLLAGVTLNFFFSAVILLIQYLSDYTQTFQMFRWMMGGLDVTDIRFVLHQYPTVMLCILGLWIMARPLNLLSFDDRTAAHLGLEVESAKRWLLLIASLMTAIVISAAGPIGFVGLVVPHLLRLVVGPDHRLLIPGSALLGGSFLVVCDTLARSLISNYELPVGIVTALVGGPFFLWLLLRSKNR